MSSSAAYADQDAVLIETPENVTFTFTPAGIGARALAYGIDFLVRWVPFLAVAIMLALWGVLYRLANLGHLAITTGLLLLFGVHWLYYVLFEYLWSGRTPGKRALGIRVVMDGGYPLTFFAAATRNLMRMVDFLPSLYAVGVAFAFAGAANKRLGDFAAGTLVVREEPFDVKYLDVIEAASASAGDAASESIALSPQEIDLITRFIQRKGGFDDSTRAGLAQRIAEGMRSRTQGVSPKLDALFEARDFAGHLQMALALAEAAAPSRGDVGVNRFVKGHKKAWLELTAFIERVDAAGLKSLAQSELREVTRLYRQAAGDLAYAKTFFGRTDLTRFLNALVGRAHNHVYRTPAAERASVVEFFRTGFPAAFQRNYSFVALALYVFIAAAAFGALAYAVDERTAGLFLSGDAIDGVRQHKLWTRSVFGFMPSSVASAWISTNNISVTIAAFALGVTAGVGTFYMLALNGLMLGTVLMLTSAHGMGYDLMSFMGGHGFIEIFVIILAGAAGLRMADALLAPGDLRRVEALKTSAKEAVLLVLGGAPVLVAAGLIEGFISPQEGVPGWLKIAFGASLLVALVAYLAKPAARRKST